MSALIPWTPPPINKRAPRNGTRVTAAIDVLSATTPEPNTGCWLWAGSVDAYGYGRMRDGAGRRIKAHRYSFGTANGFMPEVVMHLCDTPSCVNPAHLAPGSHSKNAADKARKNRHARWSSHGMSKLTALDVRSARALSSIGVFFSTLERMFGVSKKALEAAVNGRSWRGFK